MYTHECVDCCFCSNTKKFNTPELPLNHRIYTHKKPRLAMLNMRANMGVLQFSKFISQEESHRKKKKKKAVMLTKKYL